MKTILSIFAAVIIAATLLLLTLLPTGAFTRLIPVSALLATTACAVTTLLAFLTWRAERREAAPTSQSPHPSGLARLGGERARVRGSLLPWTLAALALYWLLTVLPLPASLAASGNPHRAEQNRIARDAIESVQALELTPADPIRFAISRSAAGTARYALMMIAAFALALLASHVSPRGRITLLWFLVLLTAAVAFAGIWSLRRAPQGDTLWWIFPVPHGLPGPVACFRNRNHFAAFLVLFCPGALALAAHYITRWRLFRGTLALAALATLTVGIVLSLSRGAALAWAAGMLATLLLFAIHRQWRVVIALVLVAALGGGSALAALPADARERLATLRNPRETDSYQKRTEAWRESVAVARAYPWFGAGANAFRIVYPQHRASTQGATRTHAENEYVQWVTDCGILGTILLLAFGLSAARGVVIPALLGSRDALSAAALAKADARRGSFPPAANPTLSIAALGGLAAAAAHATVDFAFHIPLYTLAAGVLAGLILPPAPVRRFSLAPPILLLLVTACFAFGWGRYLTFDEQSTLSNASLRQLTRAMTWAPTSPNAWYYFASRLADVQTPESNLLARQALRRVMQLDPNNYRLMDDVGYAFQRLGDNAGARAAFARVKELRDWMQVPDIPEEVP